MSSLIAAVPKGGATWKFLDGIAELVEAGDPIGLAAALERLRTNPERLNILANLGKSFAVANLDPAVGKGKYLNWIKCLIT